MNEWMSSLLEYLAAQPDVVAAYVFGSVAQGRARPQSDVDIAVLLAADLDEETRFDRRLRLGWEVERLIGRPTDLVVLNDAPPLLQHQVLKHGRLIFERDRAARVEFEVRAGQIYADLKPMYDFFTEVLFKEIREVGLGGRRRRNRREVDVPAE
jgi:predicted nucleotidyltransferase